MNREHKRVLGMNLVFFAVDMAITILLDRRLAKAEKPGKINKHIRKGLARNKKWGWAVAAANTAVGLVAVSALSSIPGPAASLRYEYQFVPDMRVLEEENNVLVVQRTDTGFRFFGTSADTLRRTMKARNKIEAIRLAMALYGVRLADAYSGVNNL